MTSPITPLPSIHNIPARLSGGNPALDQLRALFGALPKVILDDVVLVIKELTGVDLSSIFNGIDITQPGAVLTAIEQAAVNLATGLIQQIISAVLGGTTGQTGTGTDPVSVLFALLNQAIALPGDLLAAIFGGQATTNAQINALQNGGFSHDFAANAVTGWSNLVGTLALSARGSYIQALTETVAYRSSGATVDKLGVHLVVNPSMRGACRVGLCSDSAGTRWVGVEVYRGFAGDSLRLITGASPTLTVVQKQVDLSGTNRLSNPTTVDLKTDGVNQFTVLYNNQPVTALNWTDSGGIVAHDSSHRGVLLTSNALDRNEDGFYGPAITKVVSYAW